MLFCPHCGNMLLVEGALVRAEVAADCCLARNALARTVQRPQLRSTRCHPAERGVLFHHAFLLPDVPLHPANRGQGASPRLATPVWPDLQRAADVVFACSTRFPPPLQITKKLPLVRKKVDDVLGGDKAWDNVDQTDAVCPSCDNKRAYYMQIQIRSADEPMTTFYRCTVCKANWSSNG